MEKSAGKNLSYVNVRLKNIYNQIYTKCMYNQK